MNRECLFSTKARQLTLWCWGDGGLNSLRPRNQMSSSWANDLTTRRCIKDWWWTLYVFLCVQLKQPMHYAPIFPKRWVLWNEVRMFQNFWVNNFGSRKGLDFRNNFHKAQKTMIYNPGNYCYTCFWNQLICIEFSEPMSASQLG